MVDSPVTGRRIKRRTINYIAIGVAVVAVVFVILKGTTSGYQQAVSMTKQKLDLLPYVRNWQLNLQLLTIE